jgi:hypothetical protein
MSEPTEPHNSYRWQQQQLQPEPAGSPQLNYLQRRASEVSVGSSNGDEPNGFLMGGSYSPEPLPSKAQLFKQANSKSDRL